MSLQNLKMLKTVFGDSRMDVFGLRKESSKRHPCSLYSVVAAVDREKQH